MTKKEIIECILTAKDHLDDALDVLYGESYQRAHNEIIGAEKAYDHVLVLLASLEDAE